MEVTCAESTSVVIMAKASPVYALLYYMLISKPSDQNFEYNSHFIWGLWGSGMSIIL